MSVYANLTRLWRTREQGDWTPLRRLEEMARHFRLGQVMYHHSGARGQVEWCVWLSGWYRQDHGDVKAASQGRNGAKVKEEAAMKLMAMLWKELEHNPPSELEAMMAEPVVPPTDEQVQIDCAICGDFVLESSYANHVGICFQLRMVEQQQNTSQLEGERRTDLEERIAGLENQVQ